MATREHIRPAVADQRVVASPAVHHVSSSRPRPIFRVRGPQVRDRRRESVATEDHVALTGIQFEVIRCVCPSSSDEQVVEPVPVDVARAADRPSAATAVSRVSAKDGNPGRA